RTSMRGHGSWESIVIIIPANPFDGSGPHPSGFVRGKTPTRLPADVGNNCRTPGFSVFPSVRNRGVFC
ncbi:hypothetical protein CSUI_004813, partial [Cystoisospora suis]